MKYQTICDEANNSEAAFQLALKGDGTALDELFAPCMPQLRRTAKHLLPNTYDSEDALQDGLLSAFRHLVQFEGRSKFSTWLNSILVNAVRKTMRKQNAHPTTSIDEDLPGEDGQNLASLLVDPRANPEEEYAEAERSRILAGILEELPAAHQLVIRLCDIEGLPGKESAERLGISISALKARHHRARRSIFRKMRQPSAFVNERAAR